MFFSKQYRHVNNFDLFIKDLKNSIEISNNNKVKIEKKDLDSLCVLLNSNVDLQEFRNAYHDLIKKIKNAKSETNNLIIHITNKYEYGKMIDKYTKYNKVKKWISKNILKKN
ncbi:hypothetical protein KAJ61_01025 [Candidatus Parcubacteria bacterium]|nr:hypothetical protein [Candidatus Parcubacteria bacterium]